MSTHQCLHCDANVSTREILDGWCDNCGKKIPPSMQAGLRTQSVVTPPVANESVELNSRHILLAVAVFVVAASSAFLLLRMV
ncbi:hypothetical protein AYO40_00715 [Planctomycetaceae bacterium SCGC AG-212-D15]|nr:hypothetical protein AYO40_00715 [Planctomycetaceae bacterium SCGC AG-212-D15]